ncbi:hypothetical protein QBC46DRAFT_397013 [Diplogelasinospora grovesii]|uniref:Autophagy-related protein 33 n=1 Tax=Diplogelasinospora grovesii TaxID=303347 RepID=A0AAN6MZN5_9PEZI|nr:hypothetical protein QBC46DRAFT_397013 [Diplogelasinospora grovesii]
MAARGVSLLKFVGTVSLGLLTGLSYTLSTLTIPALLTLPSANTAAKAFDSLATSAKKHLRVLASVSGSAFVLAYILSPRPNRHPYLLYTSLLILGSRLAASDFVAPFYLSLRSPSSMPPGTYASSPDVAIRQQQRKERAAARARMEASYEVLGSDAHSEGDATGSASGEELEEVEQENMNGEEVRAKVEVFLKKHMIESAVAGLGFIMAVVGIWGDGVATIYQESVIFEF